MNTTTAAYDAALRPLTDVVQALPPEAWTASSPCEGWTARDVLRHLVETQRELLTGHGVELGGAPDVDADPAQAWAQHTTRVLQAIGDDAVPAIAYDGWAGPTTVGETLERFYVWDMVVHRWDLARTAGLDARLTDDELDRVEAGAEGFGEALYGEGICRRLDAPPADAPRDVRVLARLGRAA